MTPGSESASGLPTQNRTAGCCSTAGSTSGSIATRLTARTSVQAFGAVDSNAKDWSLGYQVAAGMGFQIADRTVLGVDYRYVAMPSFTAHTPGISIRYNF